MQERRPFRVAVLVACVIAGAHAFGAPEAAARQAAGARLEASHLTGFEWRHLGPGIISGRIVDLAVYEKAPRIVYAASASGGVWKTTNHGVAWDPVFENGRTSSLGAIAVAAENPDIVWLGTGEAWSMRANSWGDGVYRTLDGGKTWQHMGLEKTQHVGRVLIHPRDPNIVYIAAMGALWASNEERGVYKTTDGGKTWIHSLRISPFTGVADLAFDPGDPNTIYAAAFQRERRFYSFVGGGPEGGLFKTTDGGATWQRLTSGLPKGDMGRIGVSACRSQPNIVYAAIRAHDGGFYRSEDRGATWRRMTAEVQTHSGYGQVRCDPNDPNLVYVLDNNSHVTRDGGKTFKDDLTPRGEVHVDHHALWINPADSEHLVLGNDGGIYTSYDRGRTWEFMENVSVAQFYAIAADQREPFYYVYGGTQDNSSWGGPSGSRNERGVTNAEWFLTSGGDGFYAQVDPTDPNIVYSESQYGRLLRLDLRSGERRLIQPPQPLTGDLHRWNWSVPLLISPHDPTTLYFAANVLFKSTDRGDSWTVISPDLTRKLDPYQLPLQGKIQPRTAIDLRQSVAQYGNISTISESPLQPGLIAVGTDDGLVQVTADGGRTWRRVDRLPGVPEGTHATRVVLSRFDRNTLYVTLTNHQNNDFAPYVLKSPDLGRTWAPLVNGLPSGSARVIVEHLRNPRLLFLGTEIGVFVSNTGGEHWVPLDNNLPTVAVHDMLVHPRENDLVIGTHGRGIWILDDLAILEEMTPATLTTDAHLAKIRPAMQFHPVDRDRGTMGSGHFAADGPPHGAIITYYASERARARPASIDILDADGTLVRQLRPAAAGGSAIRRAIWDLRHGLPEAEPRPAGGFRRAPRGPFVLPGQYRVRLRLGEQELTQTVEVRGDSATSITLTERRLWRDTLLALAEMQATARQMLSATTQIATQVKTAQDALASRAAADKGLVAALGSAHADASRVSAALQRAPAPQGAMRSAEQDGRAPILGDTAELYDAIERWTGPPTADQRRMARENYERLGAQAASLNRLIADVLPKLGERLSTLGVSLDVPRSPIPMPREPFSPSTVQPVASVR
ncbi:MAG: VPS10 domain-containing protein [Vicinamibacterales bacterium]